MISMSESELERAADRQWRTLPDRLQAGAPYYGAQTEDDDGWMPLDVAEAARFWGAVLAAGLVLCGVVGFLVG